MPEFSAQLLAITPDFRIKGLCTALPLIMRFIRLFKALTIWGSISFECLLLCITCADTLSFNMYSSYVTADIMQKQTESERHG